LRQLPARVGDAQVIDQLEQLANVRIMLDHAVAVFVLSGLAAVFSLHMGAEWTP